MPPQDLEKQERSPRKLMAALGRMATRVSASILNAVRLYAVINESITLHHVEREDIKIDIVARFERDKLIIDGYDIGKTVEEAWGDCDYEYIMTIPASSLPRLYGLLNVQVGDRKRLLEALAERFHGNECFSAIGDFLDQNSIEHNTFTWA